MSENSTSLSFGSHKQNSETLDAPRLLVGVEMFFIVAMAFALYLINMHEALDLHQIVHAILTISKQ